MTDNPAPMQAAPDHPAPDRADALVWAMTELLLDRPITPRVSLA